MCPASINLITDSRVLEVQEIRPIDILAMLLTAMTDNKNVFSLVDVLEEFLDHHTFVEACAMLLQIVLEENGCYLYSKSISDGFRDRPRAQQAQANPILSKSSQLFRNHTKTNS